MAADYKAISEQYIELALELFRDVKAPTIVRITVAKTLLLMSDNSSEVYVSPARLGGAIAAYGVAKTYFGKAAAIQSVLKTASRVQLKEPTDKHRAKQLSKYGLSVADWDAIFKSQGYSCGCCQNSKPGLRGWCVDHSHITGRVRGILCGNCNTSIGKLGDNIEGVVKALNYLERAELPDMVKGLLPANDPDPDTESY